MAQIAEATGIAAQDVARTIGTKDAIVLNVAGAMPTDVVKALADVDPQTPAVEPLLAAHSSVLSDVVDGTGPVTLQRMKSDHVVTRTAEEGGRSTHRHALRRAGGSLRNIDG